MHQAATEQRLPDRSLSFTGNVQLLRCAQPQSGAIPPSSAQKTAALVWRLVNRCCGATVRHWQTTAQPAHAQAAPFAPRKPQPLCCAKRPDQLLAATARTAASTRKENICEKCLTEQYWVRSCISTIQISLAQLGCSLTLQTLLLSDDATHARVVQVKGLGDLLLGVGSNLPKLRQSA